MKMAPSIRREMSAYNFAELNPKISSVLVLMYPNMKDEPTMVLMKRAKYEGLHSGEISFPGGKKDEGDDSLKDTAIREANEELGLHRQNIRVLRELSYLYIPPSNFLVYPFIAYADEEPNYWLNKKEVSKIIEFNPLTLVDDKLKGVMEITNHSSGLNVTAPYYDIKGHKVWGATAIILSEIEELIRKALA
jgi:8-oxo-dGTP pyrophosphatase MutT (NUDIX family)